MKTDVKSSASHRYIKYGIVAAVEGLLFATDRDTKAFFLTSSHRTKTADKFFRRIEHLGRGGPYAIAVPLFIGYGLIFKDRKSFVVAGELAVGYGLADGVTYAVKKGVGRKRPNETESPYQFFKGGESFYSGHTVSVFTIAAVLSLNYPRQDLSGIGIHHEVPLVPITSYTLAGLVGIQRLYSNNHWGSDVFAAAVAGYSFAWLSVHFGNKYFLEPAKMTSDGTPIIGVGIRFN